DIVELQGSVDQETAERLKEACGGRTLIAVAGEFGMDRARELVASGADILMMNRTITCAEDMNKTASEYLQELQIYEVDQFRIMTDF
ncbi:MAG: bifunctional formaldehyde-activating protein/3-hexulose-6-phosphate synthase, partial [Euryarchaeota archaeon]|nr:bifunctional formaldehyde-activating protein/3-hexulose-6-phosphate synthase [Euryarchaeota archaeon]